MTYWTKRLDVPPLGVAILLNVKIARPEMTQTAGSCLRSGFISLPGKLLTGCPLLVVSAP